MLLKLTKITAIILSMHLAGCLEEDNEPADAGPNDADNDREDSGLPDADERADSETDDGGLPDSEVDDGGCVLDTIDDCYYFLVNGRFTSVELLPTGVSQHDPAEGHWLLHFASYQGGRNFEWTHYDMNELIEYECVYKNEDEVIITSTGDRAGLSGVYNMCTLELTWDDVEYTRDPNAAGS